MRFPLDIVVMQQFVNVQAAHEEAGVEVDDDGDFGGILHAKPQAGGFLHASHVLTSHRLHCITERSLTFTDIVVYIMTAKSAMQRRM